MGMKRVALGVVTVVGVGLLAVAPVRAHHAFASEFDANRPMKITGALVKVDWTNPHTWFTFDVKGADGKVERWMIETGAPAALVRRGFSKDFLKPGTEVTVEGYLAKGVARRANGRTMKFLDGKTLFVGSSGTGAPDDGKDPTETKK